MKMAKETWMQGQCQVSAKKWKHASERSMKSLKGGQSTAQIFTTMRLIGTQ